MRWIMIFAGLLAGLSFLAGCETEDTAPLTPAASLLTFRYDAARDVVIASTTPLVTEELVTAQRYADALESLPDVSYTPTAMLQLADPEATVVDSVLTVNYRQAAGLEQLASAQVTAVMAALEAWWWVPGITSVRVLAQGEPLTQLGGVVLTQPMQRGFHTYVTQPVTGEVGYLVGSLNPATPAEAVDILLRREIREFPATRGFVPLLPPEIEMTAELDDIDEGVLPVNLSARLGMAERPRIAGVVLMLTQFPDINAVRFTFNGQTVNEPFMRGNLNAPLSPYDLLLPRQVATEASGDTLAAMRAAVTASLQQAPASFGPGLVYRDWATITATPTQGAQAQIFVLRRQGQTYTVQATGTQMAVGQLIQLGVPTETLIALRVPGWEMLAAMRQ